MGSFGIAPYGADQPLSTRVAYPFRVVGVVLFLLLGPWGLWMAYEEVVTGTATLAYSSMSGHVTIRESPTLYWVYVLVKAVISLGVTAFSVVMLVGALRPEAKKERRPRQEPGGKNPPS